MAVMAVVPAAGSASRYGKAKLYEPLAGDIVIGHALRALLADVRIEQIVVVVAKDDKHWYDTPYPSNSRVITTIGGDTRAQSVMNGLDAMRAADDDWILVHDAARPCLHQEDLDKLLDKAANADCGALLAAPVCDTIKQARQGQVYATLDRSQLWRALTPQMFRYADLKQALVQATNPSDEAQAMEQAGASPTLLSGRSDNIKITNAEDLAMAEAILARR